MKLILASGSPRRKEILESAGLSFEVAPSEFDESSLKSEFPDKLVEGLALGKGLAKQALLSPTDKSENIVLAADTLVYLPEEGSTADAPKGTFLGKPHTEKIAREMLNCLSGRYHEVWSAYALLLGEKQVCRSVCTKISFRKLSENEIENYVLTKESLDKAGAYAIQSGAANFVDQMEGSYTSVVGLPLPEVLNDLRLLGFETP